MPATSATTANEVRPKLQDLSEAEVQLDMIAPAGDDRLKVQLPSFPLFEGLNDHARTEIEEEREWFSLPDG